MDNSVVIKGNKNGIAVRLDDTISFDELKSMIRDKFTASAKFFNNANLALSLEGRELSDTQEKEIIDIISEVTDINIVCLIDHDEKRKTGCNRTKGERNRRYNTAFMPVL